MKFLRILTTGLMLAALLACQSYSHDPVDKTVKDAAAHWVDANLILIAPPEQEESGVQAYLSRAESDLLIPLKAVSMPAWVAERHPHLKDFKALQHDLRLGQSKQWLKYLPRIVSRDVDGVKLRSSWLQTGFVLDRLYTDAEDDADEVIDLGASLDAQQTQFKLWAPTALQVRVKLYDQEKVLLDIQTLEENSQTGIWSADIQSDLTGKYYRYELELYHPENQRLETLEVTDPYSLSLSTNSEYSQVVDLTAPQTQPQGWDSHVIPSIAKPEDNIFYELHIRDFSASDDSLSDPATRGKYAAFLDAQSKGRKHLEDLQKAGLNNIHLLPTFDIGTVEEDANKVVDVNETVARVCEKVPLFSLCDNHPEQQQTLKQLLQSYAPHTDAAQAVVSELRTFDNYNWGYDPYHYTVPEGSYAQNPEGLSRIVEFRGMVQELHQLGFRVIMDVVYNHTHQAGLKEKSVLDKIVPGYYHRLDPVTGSIEQSTCCNNTATERKMMAKLMTDSLVTWARDYKIDGFRFDLMGHQPKDLMLAARKAVQAVDPDNYFYGEGWNFGEVANNSQFTQATQVELAGTEIGTFSDRLRDAVRGCCFNSEGDDIRKNQGIGNGLGVMPNEAQSDKSLDQYHLALDQLRIGLAGNLANFPLETVKGEALTGKEILYGEAPTGYALDPADTINYVSKHDNQTLWDNNQYRNQFELTTEQRVRMHNQNLSYVLLAQGIPFVHMGSELLRSKSYLRDSYDYGDWFNAVDFSMQTNNYHVGLPPAEKDEKNWDLIRSVIAHSEGRDQVGRGEIEFSNRVFQEFMQLRKVLPDLRMSEAQDIIQRVRFLNTGEDQQMGLIAMQIDGKQDDILILFNFSPSVQVFNCSDCQSYQLHPIQASGVDKLVKTSRINARGFTIPGLTTAVFIK